MFDSVIATIFYRVWTFALTDAVTPEMPDRSGATSSLLPLNIKDKDSRTKEENHKLLNGNSGDPADRVWWIC